MNRDPNAKHGTVRFVARDIIGAEASARALIDPFVMGAPYMLRLECEPQERDPLTDPQHGFNPKMRWHVSAEFTLDEFVSDEPPPDPGR